VDIKEKISLLPHQSGVYRYYDSSGTVIYVGKAKDLNKRVAQYFVDSSRLTPKTRVLVSRIADVQYSVVDSESDAFLLENNLIKQYKPRYNILLKDSKTYPWICVSSDEFPKVYMTRSLKQDGSRYFGPYSSVMHARALLEFFHSAYPLRTCKSRITSETLLRGKMRPCLEMHLGRCRGCCVGGISRSEYMEGIEEIEKLLTCGVNDIIREYTSRMHKASDALDFESAQKYKVRIDALRSHYSKSVVFSSSQRDADVFYLDFDSFTAFGNYLCIRGGAIIRSLNLTFRMQIEESQSSVLSSFIAEIQSKFGELSSEVLVPFLPDVSFSGVEFIIPVRGDKLSLLKLSSRNAAELRLNSLKQMEKSNPDEFRSFALTGLKEALGMDVLPVHIECFDNSNIQGTNPVAACVVFRDGVPSKKDYRKFRIKTVIGANDYASMKEVVNRRYSRMLQENPEDLPQLVVIDGGKGQLNFAWQALCELGIQDRLTVVGLAERMEEIIRVYDPYPLFLDRNSQSFRIITHIRDEAHRFGITFHRNLRSRSALRSALSDIKGVGKQTEQRLLMHYGSVPRIAACPLEDLASFVGPSLAKRIKDKLNEGSNV